MSFYLIEKKNRILKKKKKKKKENEKRKDSKEDEFAGLFSRDFVKNKTFKSNSRIYNTKNEQNRHKKIYHITQNR